MTGRYANFDRRLPKRQELGGFLRQISNDLVLEKLVTQLIDPGNPTREELYHTLPINMQLRGSYLSLASFLEQLERMERLTRVGKLKISSDPQDDKLKIEMQMNIYFTES